MTALLEVAGLDVTFPRVRAVRDVSFRLDRGECLAIVGESGSGKSVTARTLLGLAGTGATVRADRLEFDGSDLRGRDERQWRAIRGRRIGLVLQDALTSLDPLHTVGAEVREALRHRRAPRGEVLSLLADAGIPDPDRRIGQYPHELSGGLRQRALIATALAGRPDLLIADEPTTALDATAQARVLTLLGGLVRDGRALLLISHDLAVVAGLADRIAVMYAGLIVETGPAKEVLAEPRHPYTRSLLAAVPGLHPKGTPLTVARVNGRAPGPDGCPYAARCARADDRCRAALPAPAAGPTAGHTALCWHPGQADTAVPAPPRAAATIGAAVLTVDRVGKRYGDLDAAIDVSFEVRQGEAVGVVGESGSGKTTVARILIGLTEPDRGAVRLDGEPWSGLAERHRRHRRHRIQSIPQDPLSSFDPRHHVGHVLTEAAARAGVPRAARRDRVAELLTHVGLEPDTAVRRPVDLSGGQRQRVAIARALALRPAIIVCDEPVSALDVSVQAQILDLLADLQRESGMAMVFISHDLGVVRHLCDRVLVMRSGQVVEEGPAEQIFTNPAHVITRELVAAAIPRSR